MTEQEWLTSTDPQTMLPWIDGSVESERQLRRKPTSDRKLRLFACACCRQVWHLLTDPRSRRAVEVAERHADGEATEEELADAHRDAYRVGSTVVDVAFLTTESEMPRAARFLTQDATAAAVSVSPAIQAALLREIVGNPWRPVKIEQCSYKNSLRVFCPPCDGPVRWSKANIPDRMLLCDAHRRWIEEGNPTQFSFQPEQTWLTPAVLAIAQSAYEEQVEVPCGQCKGSGRKVEREPWMLPGEGWSTPCPVCHGTGTIASGALNPDTLAVLADALEEAGCTDRDILKHLRGYEFVDIGVNGHAWRPLRSPHFRGCFVLDALLGKE